MNDGHQVTLNQTPNKEDVFNLFPSPVFKTYVSEDIDYDSVLNFILNNKPGQIRSDSFSTRDDLQNAPELKELCSYVLKLCDQIADIQTLIRKELYITSMWANVAKSESYYHPQHIHPNSYLSGIVYIKGPKQCAGTMFHDPRPAVQVLEPDYKTSSILNMSRFESSFESGKVLIFPSWLPHSVMASSAPYEQDDVRITLSFNVMFHAQITKSTSPLEL